MKIKIEEVPNDCSCGTVSYYVELKELTNNENPLALGYSEDFRELSICTDDECVFIPRKNIKAFKKALLKLLEKAGE